jgi:short-subunit dehydrogenase
MPKTFESACVTGASSGIGAAFARALAARGTRSLDLVARRTDRLEALATELRPQLDACRVTPCDLTDAGSVRALAARLEADPPDLLVNNAGVGAYGPFAVLDRQRLLDCVDVNVRAIVELSHAYVRGALPHRRGTLVLVASTVGYAPVPFGAVYAATKAFTLHLGEALWEELRGTGVRVLVVAPGFTRTEFNATASLPRDAVWGKFAEPEAVVAATFAMLGRPRPAFVHGFWNSVGGYLGRALPRRTVLRAVGNWMRRGFVDTHKSI